MRPVMTRPATNPATMSITERVRRRNITIVSAHVDSTGAAIARLGDRDRQNAVLEIGGDGVDLDDLGQRKGARKAAVAALDAVVLLARNRAARIGAARAA